MIKFFKKIRQRLISENKFSKYLLYAIGEIILVVIGILIALSINNWNDKSKENLKEKLVLLEISNSLLANLDWFQDVSYKRLERKTEGISRLTKMIGENEKTVSFDSIIKLFNKSQTDISIIYDSGPYESLKTYGFEIISNDTLRKLIINSYEVTFPSMRVFGDKTQKILDPLIEEIKIKIFKKEAVQNEKGVWQLINTPKDNKILTNPDFKNLLDLENQKYNNYINRLNYVKRRMTNLNKQIVEELDYLNEK
ncbi:DUF6090 family protein [Urechidicola vernalis]|uniref:DUF6090 family protein n=1 Tax=Urechidicola vernalis TaxID=3075600 RepID=A0ABU2Y0M9_9FLAO|nr:DUF6090 family protein [Urechidicola sp. P050]MDT0551718.1 DUF6090 family protein [Urechidicola sp. P050]